MNALFDTHVLLWWLGEPDRIPPALMARLREKDAVLYYSQISLLEIQIKSDLGKLRMDFPNTEVPILAERAGLDALPLGNEAIFMLSKLPNLHRDPFDRLLVCEAIQHGLTLISSDKIMRRYPVKLQWT